MRCIFAHRYLIVLLFVALSTLTLQAQVGWAPVTPLEGGEIAGFVRKPSTGYLFVGTANNGVFRSSNEGVLWTGCSTGLPVQGVRDLALASDGSLYTATNTTVYRSDNDGASWLRCNTLNQVRALACDKNGRVFAGSDSGVFRSDNNGAAWVRVAPFRKSVTALTITKANHIFAGNDSGVYRSVDNGNTWARIVSGIPPVTFAWRTILFADTVNGDVYVGNQVSELYRSSNNGDTWTATTPLHSPTTTQPITMIFRHPATRVLFVMTNTLWKSYDAGANWQNVAVPFPMKWTTRMTASGPTGALLGGTGGILFSPDSSSVWQLRNNGLNAVSVLAMLADDNAIYISSTSNGIYKTMNSGSTWTYASAALEDQSIGCIAHHPPSNTLFATSDERLYRSSDGGGHWALSDSGLGRKIANSWWSNVSKIAVHPSGSIFAYDWYRAIFRSRDGGRYWTNVNNGLPDTLVSALAASDAGSSAGTLFVGTMSGKMFHSSNEGDTWVQDTAGVPANGFITSMIVSNKTGTVLMHSGGWICRSTDAGRNWTKIIVKSGLQNFTIHKNSGQLFIITSPIAPTATLYRSADDGLTWQDAGSVLPNYSGPRLMADSSSYLWVGHTNGGEVYRTQQVVPVTFSAFSAWLNQGHALLRWTTVYEERNYGFGIEKRALSGKWTDIGFVQGAGSSDALQEYTFTDPAKLTAPATYRLRQTDYDGSLQYSSEVSVYASVETSDSFAILETAPSPARGETQLRFSLPESGNVRFEIYNILGQSRLLLLNEHRESGMHALHFDASDLTPGFYLIKGSTNTSTAVRPLLVR
ncbi:MAG: T9SS type A sorting domain-containing protein [Bacteroidota bacterium]